MKRSPRIVALSIVVLAVGTAGYVRFGATRPKPRHHVSEDAGTLRLLLQRACSAKEPCELRALANWKPRALIEIAGPESWFPNGGSMENWLFFRIVGEGASPLFPVSIPQTRGRTFLAVIAGYGTPPKNPKLEAVRMGKVIAGIPLGELPVEQRVLSKPRRPDARLRVFDASNRDFPFRDTALQLRFAPSKTPWDVACVDILATTHQAETKRHEPYYSSTVEPGVWEPHIWLPNANHVDALKVAVEQFWLKAHRERATLKGATLVVANGKPFFRVDRLLQATFANGWRIDVPPQNAEPRRPLRRPSRAADLNILCRRTSTSVDRRLASVARIRTATFRLVSPRAEDLGLTAIIAGNVPIERRQSANGPIKTGPVNLVIEIVHHEPVKVNEFIATVPVEQGSAPSR